MYIWCLFTIVNEYDQPSFNLAVWFTEKPSYAQLNEVLQKCVDEVHVTDDQSWSIQVGQVYRGLAIDFGQVEYRLCKVRDTITVRNQLKF